MSVIRLIDHGLYPRKAISEARAAYKDYCSVHATPVDSLHVRIEVSVLPQHKESEREVILSFLNFALDKAAEISLRESA
jgi:hypothetical protein